MPVIEVLIIILLLFPLLLRGLSLVRLSFFRFLLLPFRSLFVLPFYLLILLHGFILFLVRVKEAVKEIRLLNMPLSLVEVVVKLGVLVKEEVPLED